MKILNATYLIRYPFKIRLLSGIIFYIMGFTFIYWGFIGKSFLLICLGSMCMGFDATITFLAILGFMKYYPSKYFMLFMAGNISGGCTLTVLYLICSYYEIKIYNVGFFVNVTLSSFLGLSLCFWCLDCYSFGW
jgi:hypothetical protein